MICALPKEVCKPLACYAFIETSSQIGCEIISLRTRVIKVKKNGWVLFVLA